MNLSLNESLQLLSSLLIVLTIVYKAGKIEQKIETVVSDIKDNKEDIAVVANVQGRHEANLAALNQATGVYSR